MMPYPYPVVPETITVHLGAPGESARNVVVPFAQYIKNVASHEIYPTWPESAIRANILAQISYALNRVYTEYYRARGYDFDITSTTRYDQAYVEDGDIFENISRIVDDIFNNYIVRQGSVEPLFAQFCDGVRTRCGGLSQWGSVDLAEEGMTPYEILQYYYGGDINLVMNAPVGGNVASYPGRPLRRGDAGNDVQTLKRQLNRIGKNYPAIPALDDSFVFDEDMEEAVRVFQQIFNLAQDGIVGKATWYKIKQIYNGVKQLSELSSEGLTIPEVQRRYAEDLRLGDSGIDVRTVRFYLAFLGYFLPELPMISLSDDFDQELLDAVYTFQRVYGLPVDGVVGRETWNALQTAYQKVLAELPEDYRQFAGEVYPGRFLVRGDRGEQVALMQERLNQISREDETLPSLVVDGIFGPATQQAVLTLQRQLGFDPTGAVGPVLCRRSLRWARSTEKWEEGAKTLPPVFLCALRRIEEGCLKAVFPQGHDVPAHDDVAAEIEVRLHVAGAAGVIGDGVGAAGDGLTVVVRQGQARLLLEGQIVLLSRQRQLHRQSADRLLLRLPALLLQPCPAGGIVLGGHRGLGGTGGTGGQQHQQQAQPRKTALHRHAAPFVFSIALSSAYSVSRWDML